MRDLPFSHHERLGADGRAGGADGHRDHALPAINRESAENRYHVPGYFRTTDCSAQCTLRLVRTLFNLLPNVIRRRPILRLHARVCPDGDIGRVQSALLSATSSEAVIRVLRWTRDDERKVLSRLCAALLTAGLCCRQTLCPRG